MAQEINGWLFPDDLDVDESDFYRMKFGDTERYDLDWNSHVDLAHQRGLEQVDARIHDSGVDGDGVRYAAVRAEVVVEGEAFAALGGADETSQQVRDPEHVWSVAESRALKRAVKKALNIRPAPGKGSPDERPTTDVSRDSDRSRDRQRGSGSAPSAGDDGW